MEDELGLRVGEHPLGVVEARQVVVAAPRDEHVVPVGLEPLDEVRSEEAPAAGDEDAAHRVSAGRRVSQSTRPSQLSRCSAYHWIVRSTPSSHETFGSQPVSACSFS